MRLIDAEILRDRLYKTRNAALADGRNKAYGKGIRDAIEILEAQQTVEPELLKEQEAMNKCLKKKCVICPHCENCDIDENGTLKEQEAVVRCKDCAFYADSANCPVFGMDRYGDWLCADGKRKEGGEQE